MRLRTISNVRLTDFTNGRLENPRNGRSVDATDLAREIALFFRDEGRWTDFPRASETDAVDVLHEMSEVGLVTQANEEVGSEPLLEPVHITMFGAPRRELSDVSPGEIVFVGAPIDFGATGYPGARYGPAALRSASIERYRCEFDLRTNGLKPWNVPALNGNVLSGARMSDLGDVVYRRGSLLESYYTKLRTVLDQVYSAGAVPMVLGGDHSITYSTVKRGVDTLLHLDAHCDLARLHPGDCHHHGNVLSRLVKETIAPRIVHYGLRDTSGADTVNAGTIAFNADHQALSEVLRSVVGRETFISIDVDVLDPAILPGTGTPVPGGFQLRELCQALAAAIEQSNPVGFDLVEHSPMRDETGNSARQLIEVILVCLAVFYKTHQNNVGQQGT